MNNLAKWLVNKFKNFRTPPTLAIKYSIELVEKLREFKITVKDRLISWDVVSLFPNTPVNTALDNLKDWLTNLDFPQKEIDEYLMLTSLRMEQNIFSFNGKYYKQTFGTAMGNPHSPFLANLFLSNLELEMKHQDTNFPKFWARYVDDIFANVDENFDVDEFTNTLNSKYPSISFTFEMENDGSLPFLDLTISRNSSKTIDFDIFRKLTSSQIFIPADSVAPWSYKTANFNFLVNRLLTILLNNENFKKEKQLIFQIAERNGYDRQLVQKIIRRHKSKQLFDNIIAGFTKPRLA